MSSSPFHVEEDPEDESWLMTYADAITNLMAFFIILVAMSTIDMPAYEKASTTIKSEIGGNIPILKPTEAMQNALQDVIVSMQANEAVEVGTDNRGLVLEMKSRAFYRSGTADILPDAIPVLDKIAKTVLAPQYKNYILEVEGHTDDDPISTAVFPSNWELSAGRASRVVRFMTDAGMEIYRLKAAGYASSRPKLPNRTATGAPIRENQAENRRVVMKIFPVTEKEMTELKANSEGIGKTDGNKADIPPAPAKTP